MPKPSGLVRRVVFCLAFVVSMLTGCASSQSDGGARVKRARTAEDYRPGTLATLADTDGDGESLGNKMETMLVFSKIDPTRASVKCGGATRAMPSEKSEVLRQWARLYAGSMDHYTVPYTSEMRFVENGREHWVAVRSDDIADVETACAAGGVALNVIRLGAAREGDRWEPLLLLESLGD